MKIGGIIFIIIFFVGLLGGSFYYMGFFSGGYIRIKKDAWYPDLGVSECDIYIHKDGNTVYLDTFKWTPQTYDSLLSVHLKMAKNFKP